MKKIMILAAAMAMGLSAAASSAATFAYQGVLRDEFGKPLVDTKTVTIDFKIYESADGDTAVWGRQMTVSIDTNGLFNAELADGNGSATVSSSDTLADVISKAELKQGVSLYVGLTVKNSTGEIRPRQKLLPVPMAAYAQDVREAKSGFKVTGDLQVSGSIGSEDGVLSAKSLQVSGGDASSFSTPVEFAAGATVGGSDLSKTNLTVSGVMEVKGNINLADGCSVMLNGKYNALLPVGTIILWSGNPSSLPSGWVVCAPRQDGTTVQYTNPYDHTTCSVPDLRGRFVVGANYASEGGAMTKNAALSEYKMNATADGSQKSGEETHKLTTEEMPSHTHKTTHTTANDDSEWRETGSSYLTVSKNNGGNVERETDARGGDQAHENRPPFYALCYIIFIGDSEVK